MLQEKSESLPLKHMVAILQRVMQLCFNGKQRTAVAAFADGPLKVLSKLFMQLGENPTVAEAISGIVWLLCFTGDIKRDVKDDKHSILSLLHTAHISMPHNGPVQERFSAIRAMCKLGGSSQF
jgi:hypothetical protein